MGIKLHNRLKIIRRQSTLRQEDLAKELGISLSSFSRYETGKRIPDANLLVKMAKILGCNNLGWLLTGEGLLTQEEEVYIKKLLYAFKDPQGCRAVQAFFDIILFPLYNKSKSEKRLDK